MNKYFWIVVCCLSLVLGVNAQVNQPSEWATIQKNLTDLSRPVAIQYLDSVWQASADQWSALDRIELLKEKGTLYRKTGNYAAAIEQYDWALAHFQSLEGQEHLRVHCLFFAGQSAIRMLNYEKAMAYFEQVLNSPEPGNRIASSQRYLLMALNYSDRPAEVIQRFEAMDNFKQIKPLQQIRLLKEYGIALAKQQQSSTAQRQVERILQIGALGEAKKPGLLDYAQYQAAEILIENGQSKKAADIYLKNIHADVRFTNGEKARAFGKKYDRLGTAYFDAGNYQKALEAYQQALIQIFPNFNNEDYTANPSLSSIVRESFMMTSPAMKARCLRALHETQSSKALLENAAACHALSLEAVTQLLNGYQTDEPKIFLQEYINEYLEDAMETSFELATAYQEAQAAEDALAFANTQKAIVLRQALAKNAALITSKVPQELQEEDKKRSAEIQQLRLELSATASTAKSQMDSLQQLLNAKISDYNAAAALLKRKYPAYAGLLQKQQNQSLQNMQKQLQADQAVLQFYWGEKQLYAFWITKDTIRLHRQAIATIELAVNEFINLISDRKLLENNSQRFFDLGQSLAQQLFYETSANEKKLDIIVIPDGPLFFIPFGAFLSGKYAGPYQGAPYLLNRHNFTYAYSLDLYFSNTSAHEGNGQVFGAFPFLSQSKRNLTPLPSGAEEVDPIAKYTQVYSDQSADLRLFQESVSAFSVIHLSTHASTGDALRPPRIEFADSSLFLTQLYSSRLVADLVVLSACQTSLGDLKSGEGAMSLARGFSYAGANNLITTLWSVNEKSTSHLIQSFYQQALTNNHSYSKALTAAQRSYLQDPAITAQKKSPYYWAGLHLNGRDGHLRLRSEWSWRKLWIPASLLLAFLAWTFFRKKSVPKG